MESFNPGGVPDIFSEFDKHSTLEMQYAYVEHVLNELAKDGTLYLTDVLRQPDTIRIVVGEVICGLRREMRAPSEFEQTRGHSLPEELSAYRVRLRSIPWMKQFDKPTKYGTTETWWEEVENEPIRFQRPKKLVTNTQNIRGTAATGNAKAHAEDWFDAGKPQVDLSVRDAFWALSQYGKNVKYAKTQRRQRELWRFEEVHPSEKNKPVAEPPKRKRGRPKKAKPINVEVSIGSDPTTAALMMRKVADDDTKE